MVDSDPKFRAEIIATYTKKIEELTNRMVNEEITDEVYKREVEKLQDEIEEKSRKHYAEMANKEEKKMTEEEIDEKYNHDLNDLIRRHIAHEVSEEEYKKERDRIGREYEEGIKQLNTKKVRAKAKSALKKEETKMTPEEIEQEFNKKLDELIAQKGNLQAEEWEKKRKELKDWRKEEEKKAALEPESKQEEEKKMTPEEATKELEKVLGYPDEFDKIRELIKAGANINTQTKYGLTLLYAICAPSGKNTPEEKKAAKELFMELLNHKGINPNLPNADDGDLPLGAAALSQDFDYVRALAEHGANFLAPLSKTTNWPYSSWEELLLDKFKRDKNAIAFIQETIKKQKEAAEKAETNDETIVPHEEGKKMTPEEALKKLKDLYKDQNSARDDETKKVKLEDIRNLVSLLDNSTINQTIYHDTYDVMLGDLAIDFGNEELFKLLDEKGFDWKKQQENVRISIGAALSGNETSLLYLAEKGLLNLDETDLDEKETAQDIIKNRFSNSDDLLKRISEVEKSSEANVVEEEGKPAAEPAPDPEPTPEPSPDPEPTRDPSPADEGPVPPPEPPVPPTPHEPPRDEGDEEEDDGDPSGDDPNANEDDGEIDQEKLNIQEGILGFWKEIEKTNPELYESLGKPAEMFDHPELAEEKRKAMFEAFQRDPELVKKYKDTVSKILGTEEGKEIFQRIFKDRTGNVSMDDIINTLTGNGNSSENGNGETNQPAPKEGPGLGKRLGDALKGATDNFCKAVFEQNFNTSEDFAQAFLFNLLAYPLDAANIFLTKEYEDDEKKLLKKILNEMKNKDNGGRDGRDGEDGCGGGERGGGDHGGDRSGSSDAYVALAEANARAAEAQARATEAQARATEAQARAAEARAKADAEAARYTADANAKVAEANKAAAEANQATAKANEANASAFTNAIGELATGMKDANQEQAKQFAEAFDKISKENRDFLEKNSVFLKDTVEKMMNSNDETRKMISDSLKEAISAFKEGNKGDSADAVQKALDTCKEIIAEREKTEQERIKQENETKRQLEAEKTAQTEIREQGKTDRAEIQKTEKETEASRILAKGKIYASPQNGGEDTPAMPPPKTPTDGKGGESAVGKGKTKEENLPFDLPKKTSPTLKEAILKNYNRVLNSEKSTEEKAKDIAKFLDKMKELKPEIEKVTKAYDLIANHRDLLDDMHLVKKGARKGELHRNDIKKLEKEGLDPENVKMAMGLRKRLEKGSKDGDPRKNEKGKGRD